VKLPLGLVKPKVTKLNGGVGVWLHRFLILAIDEDDYPSSRSGRYTREEYLSENTVGASKQTCTW
jgi:hypothetical protein